MTNNNEEHYWTCPHCGHHENWFDRTFYTHKDGTEEGPFTRCCSCGMADSDPVEKENYTKYADEMDETLAGSTVELIEGLRSQLELIEIGLEKRDEEIAKANESLNVLKKEIHHMVACCGNPNKDDALRNVIKIGQKAIENSERKS